MRMITMKDVYSEGKKIVMVTHEFKKVKALSTKVFGRMVNVNNISKEALDILKENRDGEYTVCTVFRDGVMMGYTPLSTDFMVLSDSQFKTLRAYINKVNPKGIMDEFEMLPRQYFVMREPYKKTTVDLGLKAPDYTDDEYTDAQNKFRKLIQSGTPQPVKGKLMFSIEDVLEEFKNLRRYDYNILTCDERELLAMVSRFKMCDHIKDHIKKKLDKDGVHGTHLRLVHTLYEQLELAFKPSKLEKFTGYVSIQGYN